MKKFVLLVTAVALCMTLLVACGSPQAEPSETPSASAAPASGDYLSWTNAEWEAASDSEKAAAAEAVLLAVGDAMVDGSADLVELAKTDENAKKQIDEQIEQLKSSIGVFLSSSPDATIQGLVDASKEALNG